MSFTFKPRAWYEDEWPTNPGTIGSGHSVSGEVPEADVIDRLHDVVEEVTRKPVVRLSKSIGFIKS